MTFQTERDFFLLEFVKATADPAKWHGAPYENAKKLLRHAQTLHRLAVAQCNGDFPADHGSEWKTEECSRCGSHWHPSAMRRERSKGFVGGAVCPDCRTQDAVRRLLVGTPFQPVFGGDPRGAVLKLAPIDASQATIDNGTARLLCVPVRER